MDLRQTKEYANFLKQIGWEVGTIESAQVFIKKIPILGSALKFQRYKKIPFKELEKLAKKHRAFQIIVEPLESGSEKTLKNHGYKTTNSPYLPTKTLQIDLAQTEEQILAQMTKDGRYSLRKSKKSKEIIKEESDLQQFRENWFAVVRHKRHILPLSHLVAFKKAFGKSMLLLTNKDSTAGGMFLKTVDTAYYWIGFTSHESRNSLVQYQIIWNAIVWARKNGCKYFDFEGIYDERFPKSDWQGFSHFKKSFGGSEVMYPGCYTKWRVPL